VGAVVKIEPEIVFKLRAPVDSATLDAAGETWTAALQGIALRDLTLTTTP
jgi:hypothetical protein